VFAVSTNGTGFTNLHSFNYSDGTTPHAGLILSGNTLYGTAYEGGSSGQGTVFTVHTNGTGFTNLYSFTAVLNSTNSDGAIPIGNLILSGNTLYGTAGYGGSSGAGTVFRLNTDGTSFTNLYSLNGSSDGTRPYAGLILSGNTLYGTAFTGGSSGNGTIFSINLAPLNIKTNSLAVSQLSGGMAQLTYLGTPGAKFALDWAHGLNTPIIWTPLATNTTTPDGYLIFTNTASGTNDFYRIRSVP
jgi:uncharacterized repeat protein (TIGR03803 family)